jgi:hypothetical protein
MVTMVHDGRAANVTAVVLSLASMAFGITECLFLHTDLNLQ